MRGWLFPILNLDRCDTSAGLTPKGQSWRAWPIWSPAGCALHLSEVDTAAISQSFIMEGHGGVEGTLGSSGLLDPCSTVYALLAGRGVNAAARSRCTQ